MNSIKTTLKDLQAYVRLAQADLADAAKLLEDGEVKEAAAVLRTGTSFANTAAVLATESSRSY